MVAKKTSATSSSKPAAKKAVSTKSATVKKPAAKASAAKKPAAAKKAVPKKPASKPAAKKAPAKKPAAAPKEAVKKAPAAAKPVAAESEVITLPVSADIVCVTDFMTEIAAVVAKRPDAVTLDAGKVERITTPVLQVMLSLEQTLAEDSKSMHVANVTAAMEQACDDLGLKQQLEQWRNTANG